MINIHQGDCLEVMPTFSKEMVDVVCCSPPYNTNTSYNNYKDNLPWPEYYEWLGKASKEIHRILKPDGSFFLNISSTPKQPWTAMRVAEIFGRSFFLQNQIAWVKSIVIDGKTHGHYQPLNSKRFLNNNWEYVFHFTKEGNRELDHQALSVPYVDEKNKERFQTTGKAPQGNCWYIKYESRNQKNEAKHPAVFPVELPERCIKLHGLSNDMVVCDPFAGICNTLVACRNLSTEKYNINGVGIEIDPEYVKIAKERLGII